MSEAVDRDVPTPALVAAWLALDILRAELVPMWAANWLVQGYDGKSLAELAGLSGRDTREVRDLLPAALAEVGVESTVSKQAAAKLAYDQIARLHLTGQAPWRWVIAQVVEIENVNLSADEFFEQPLGTLWPYDDELGEPWSRPMDDLAELVRRACIEQVQGQVGAGQERALGAERSHTLTTQANPPMSRRWVGRTGAFKAMTLTARRVLDAWQSRRNS